jgi:hypothetical protein
VRPLPRYGHGKPPHPILAQILAERRSAYEEVLRAVLARRSQLLAIPATGSPETAEPFWSNGWCQGLDAACLYCFLADLRPRLYIEIGSGHSTRFARRAIRDNGLPTTITSIDPQPRAEVEEAADHVVRRPLEQVDLSLFDALGPGDVLFFDGSHRVFMNSDTTVFFLELLPALPPGVLVQVHDVHLPLDYPPERARHWESEQYLLAAWLLASPDALRVRMPVAFVRQDEALRAVVNEIVEASEGRIEPIGAAFWFETGAGR